MFHVREPSGLLWSTVVADAKERGVGDPHVICATRQEAQECAEENRRSGTPCRVFQRDVRADGARLRVWVVVWT